MDVTKVLVVHNRYRSAQPSGEDAVVQDEARLLAEHGCDVTRLEVESDDIAAWPPYRQAALPLRVVWSREGSNLVRAAIRRYEPEIVHFHNTFPLLSPAVLWAARACGVGVVQTLHNFRALCPAATFLRDGHVCEDCLGRLPWPGVVHGCYRGSRAATAPLALASAAHRLIDTWARCVDVFIAPSEFTRQKYVEAGWQPDKITVKYNTVPDESIERGSGGPDFVCLARLGSEKGIDVLLEAWGEAFPSGEQRLAVVGSGDEELALRHQARELCGVQFVGRVDRVAALRVLANARAAVIPSRCYEGFPRVLVEAYSLGVPVIASRLGALSELVAHLRTGLLFEAGSSSALADALRRFADSPALAARLSDGARRAYETTFGPAPTIEALIRIYDQVASGRRGSSVSAGVAERSRVGRSRRTRRAGALIR